MRAVGLALAVVALAATPARAADLASEVNPLDGTMPPGFVFPGAVVPFGMVQNSPDTTGQFAYGGYDYSDPPLRAFSLVHLSGPGGQKGGANALMPALGPAAGDPSVFGPPVTPARADPAAG